MDGALVVWVPDAGVFFHSDIHVPYSESAEPRTDRLATECWFADWAVRNLPESARVINSHSSVVTPVSRLADYLSNPACAGNG